MHTLIHISAEASVRGGREGNCPPSPTFWQNKGCHRWRRRTALLHLLVLALPPTLKLLMPLFLLTKFLTLKLLRLWCF